MYGPGEYADTLRTLGGFIERVGGGGGIAISDQGGHVAMSWLGRFGSQEEHRYSPLEVQALRTSARLMRGLVGGHPRFSTSELLRTLGRELDAASAEGVGLMETPDGFWVSAHVKASPFDRLYTFGELVSRAQDYHRWRLSFEAERPVLPQEPIDPAPISAG